MRPGPGLALVAALRFDFGFDGARGPEDFLAGHAATDLASVRARCTATTGRCGARFEGKHVTVA